MAHPVLTALVMTGAGRAFSAGDDMKDMGPVSGHLPVFSSPVKEWPQRLIRSLLGLPKPTVAAINGFAHGTGSDLALACDFRIAAEDARLGDIRTSRGFKIASGAPWLWPRLVGINKAIEYLFTGDTLDGREAERIGLVNRAVPREQPTKEALSLAQRLSELPTKAVGLVKKQLHESLQISFEESLDRQVQDYYTVGIRDAEEGRAALQEKRKPQFKGI